MGGRVEGGCIVRLHCCMLCVCYSGVYVGGESGADVR